ncbi:MAG: 1,4-alpha-glucan branching protein GlgB, partial [Xanthomonadales bacterium]|nr:1,4-alpha-glucan branching protein GlgB [Xanthomonadales bacterium]
RVVRGFFPNAKTVTLVDTRGQTLAPTEQFHPGGLFVGELPGRKRRYRFEVVWPDDERSVVEDPYRFPSTLGEVDLYLLGEGSHHRIFDALGARTRRVLGIDGTRFAVWAPNAMRVSVVGDFNSWDGRRHGMRFHPGSGIWEIFIPDLGPGTYYKFEVLDAIGRRLPLKTDPLGQYCEPPPGNASIVYESRYEWSDQAWMRQRGDDPGLDRPMSIYEVHLGSWRRTAEGRSLSYRDLADQLADYVTEMGFTHVELLPPTEHPFEGSWGYQPTGLYAPTHRFGEPDDLRYLVDRCHQDGIGVIMDWVPAHFPKDEHGLARFDGTALYEHADPRKGEHADWGTLIYNYGRREVLNFLVGSALYWIEEFHIDALRVDAVASMLYLDYSREDGQWVPNEYGGNENLEAVAFLRRLNEEVHARGATTLAEESTAWPGVSRPTYAGGLGFTYKWNMGWMHDTLSYMGEDPIHRKYHHDKMTFGLVYAFNENFVLPLSHDEVVHGKRSLLGRMPGDEWQRFANLRTYFAAMYAHPGKKLLFMGGEFAQKTEWNHDRSLDWHLLDQPLHLGVQRLMRDLNHGYRKHKPLHEVDFESAGFQWIRWDDKDNCVLSWIRRDRAGRIVVCVFNMTPVVRQDYALGVPCEGQYRTIINSDEKAYGGSGITPGRLVAEPGERDDQPCTLILTLPPLAGLWLVPTEQPNQQESSS